MERAIVDAATSAPNAEPFVIGCARVQEGVSDADDRVLVLAFESDRDVARGGSRSLRVSRAVDAGDRRG
jgi:hypothetical protein